MKLYDYGLTYLQKNSPQYKIKNKDIGIVTATDSNTFIGVQTLFASVKNKINFLCYDIGLAQKELDWATENNMPVKQFKICIKQIDKWQTYLKPFFIKKSPYKYTLWIDSDCIVTGDLSTLDVIMNKQTFFVQHWIVDKYLAKNQEDLYKKYPVEGISANINAGVFAINKATHSNILNEWLYLINIVVNNEEIRNLTACWDEGCLNWALKKTNSGNLVLKDYRYNCNTSFNSASPEKRFYESPTVDIGNHLIPSKFFKEVLNSKVFINHFSTCMENDKKYWTKWNDV